MKDRSIQLQKEKLLLVEGKDEEFFFEKLLQKHNIQEIQVIAVYGKQRFRKYFPELKKISGFNKKVSSLAVIHDADKDAYGSFQSICSTLKRNGFTKLPKEPGSFALSDPKSSGPKIGVFIIPNNKDAGMLESLCLSTVESEEIKECIDSFMECMKSRCGKEPKNPAKARCKAFLSAGGEDASNLGIAAQKGYWDLDSPELKLLSDFLKKI